MKLNAIRPYSPEKGRLRTVVILGATGLVGKSLTHSLASVGYRVICVQRNARPSIGSVSYEHADTTNEQSLHDRLGHIEGEFLLINLVLDKASPSATQHSIIATVQNIHTFLTQHKNVVGVVGVSTTAVLAPRFLQTSYARAKYKELTMLAKLPVPVVLLLCPQITEAKSQQITRKHSMNYLDRYTVTLYQVSSVLTQAINEFQIAYADKNLYVFDNRVCLFTPGSQRISRLRLIWYCISASYLYMADRSQRMYYERAISYTALAMLPRALRKKWDHHLMNKQAIKVLASNSGYTVKVVTGQRRG